MKLPVIEWVGENYLWESPAKQRTDMRTTRCLCVSLVCCCSLQLENEKLMLMCKCEDHYTLCKPSCFETLLSKHHQLP